MKLYTKIIVVIFCLFLLNIYAYSFDVNSFRYNTTAGIFEDNYDLVLLNPAYLMQVKNWELYTDLSFKGYFQLGALGIPWCKGP